MRNIDIFKAIASGKSFKSIAKINLLSCSKIFTLYKNVIREIKRHDIYMVNVDNSTIRVIRDRSDLWIWAADQLEQA